LRSKTLPQGESSACGFDPRRGFAPRIGAESRATASSARSKFSHPAAPSAPEGAFKRFAQKDFITNSNLKGNH